MLLHHDDTSRQSCHHAVLCSTSEQVCYVCHLLDKPHALLRPFNVSPDQTHDPLLV